jgi:hypothetical protein
MSGPNEIMPYTGIIGASNLGSKNPDWQRWTWPTFILLRVQKKIQLTGSRKLQKFQFKTRGTRHEFGRRRRHRFCASMIHESIIRCEFYFLRNPGADTMREGDSMRDPSLVEENIVLSREYRKKTFGYYIPENPELAKSCFVQRFSVDKSVFCTTAKLRSFF